MGNVSKAIIGIILTLIGAFGMSDSLHFSSIFFFFFLDILGNWLLASVIQNIAQRKHLSSPRAWFWFGFFFFVIALICVSVKDAKPDPNDYTICPFCLEPIRKGARVCPHCRKEIEREHKTVIHHEDGSITEE